MYCIHRIKTAVQNIQCMQQQQKASTTLNSISFIHLFDVIKLYRNSLPEAAFL